MRATLLPPPPPLLHHAAARSVSHPHELAPHLAGLTTNLTGTSRLVSIPGCDLKRWRPRSRTRGEMHWQFSMAKLQIQQQKDETQIKQFQRCERHRLPRLF